MLEPSWVEIHWNCSPVNKTEGEAGGFTAFCADSVAHLKDWGGKKGVWLCPEALTV